MAFVSKAGSHIAPSTKKSESLPGLNLVNIYSDWKGRVTKVLTDFLIDLW